MQINNTMSVKIGPFSLVYFSVVPTHLLNFSMYLKTANQMQKVKGKILLRTPWVQTLKKFWHQWKDFSITHLPLFGTHSTGELLCLFQWYIFTVYFLWFPVIANTQAERGLKWRLIWSFEGESVASSWDSGKVMWALPTLFYLFCRLASAYEDKFRDANNNKFDHFPEKSFVAFVDYLTYEIDKRNCTHVTDNCAQMGFHWRPFYIR